MNSTDDVLNQALVAMDAEDAELGADESTNDKGKGVNDEQDTEDATDSKPESGKDADESADKGDDKPETDKPDKAAETDGEGEPEGEYTADDALEVDDTPAPVNNAPVDQAGIQLSPTEQKYIVDNIGDPLVLNGYKLDKDGNQVEYSVKAYSWANVPRDFKFVSEADQGQAATAFNALEQKANNLVQEKRAEQSRQAALDYEARENEAIRSDIADLQKEGRMPKFRVRPGEPGFDEDPAAQIVAEVEKIMADKNAQYLNDHNTKGKAYRHIGFEQAYDIYERTNPARQAARKTDAAQDAEDKARKSKAERGDSNRGDIPKNIMKATVAAGTTNRDLMAMLDAEELN